MRSYMSEVSLNLFVSRFKDELGIDRVEILDTSLSELSEFDSMGKINISLLIEELFNYQIDYEDLNRLDKIHDLYEHCIKNVKNDRS